MAIRIDAHAHFLRYRADQHVWVTDELSVLRRDFLPGELEPLLAAAGFDGCLAVQARQSEAENHFLLGLAEATEVVWSVVGWVDLCADDVADEVARWAAHPQFVGVRHVLIDEPDDGYISRAEFGRGLRAIAAADLTYELLIAPRHLAAATAVVDEHPGLRFVVDHAGLPDVRGGGIEPWRRGMVELARRPNVACKLSALEFTADWRSWQTDDLRPYQQVVLDAFGAERVMVGSNWPVCTVAGTYDVVVGATAELIREQSPADRAAMLGGTCQRWYRP